MNRPVVISGRVIHGDHYGRALGFPTANLDRRDYVKKKLQIRFGIYAGWATVGADGIRPIKRWKAGIVIGPLDKTGRPKLEAHLIGFKGILYGRRLVITLQQYLRPFRNFPSEDKLRQQIRRDVENIKKLTKSKRPL